MLLSLKHSRFFLRYSPTKTTTVIFHYFLHCCTMYSTLQETTSQRQTKAKKTKKSVVKKLQDIFLKIACIFVCTEMPPLVCKPCHPLAEQFFLCCYEETLYWSCTDVFFALLWPRVALVLVLIIPTERRVQKCTIQVPDPVYLSNSIILS